MNIILNKEMRNTLAALRRVDEKGSLYYMKFTEKYDRPSFKNLFKLMGNIKYTGCSAFIASNPESEYSVARNYDLPGSVTVTTASIPWSLLWISLKQQATTWLS